MAHGSWPIFMVEEGIHCKRVYKILGFKKSIGSLMDFWDFLPVFQRFFRIFETFEHFLKEGVTSVAKIQGLPFKS